ncbi:hypothetical protein BRAS3843_1480005 [Bradyrhizobium sp. STM 3843]|nr:hypothetical protein BRAS3843_1480005 [Bradyrhizobium sp. STM 3843]
MSPDGGATAPFAEVSEGLQSNVGVHILPLRHYRRRCGSPISPPRPVADLSDTVLLASHVARDCGINGRNVEFKVKGSLDAVCPTNRRGIGLRHSAPLRCPSGDANVRENGSAIDRHAD